MPDRKFFAVNLTLKLFHATITNADTGSLKSLHTLFDTYLTRMLAKFEPNHSVRNVQNFERFDKKPSILKPFLTKT